MAYNWKRQASVAYGCAQARLALNFFLFYEEMPETYEEENGSQKELDRLFMELLGKFLSGESEELLEAAGELRKQVQQEMLQVMAYSDGLQIYEYVLNRMERRFQKCLPLETDETGVAANLMRYIAAPKDAAVQNQRIQMIVGQLPVRFTKQKYFGMVHDALTSYIGSDPAGLEDMMYLLRSGSMVSLAGMKQKSYKKLDRIFAEFQKLSFKEMDKSTYENARSQAEEAGNMVTALMSYCTNLQEMVNDLYILCLTRESAVRDAGEEKKAAKIIKGLWQLYCQGNREIPEELEDCLSNLEGIQEAYYEKYQQTDFSRKDGRDGTEEEREDTRRGEMVDRLMSSSTFAVLETGKTSGSVSREDVEAAADLFFSELGPVLSSCQKPVARAIMATTLSYLPVCFNSPEEIRDYIQGSLSCCTDQFEKEACMELLVQIMESDGYGLL